MRKLSGGGGRCRIREPGRGLRRRADARSRRSHRPPSGRHGGLKPHRPRMAEPAGVPPIGRIPRTRPLPKGPLAQAGAIRARERSSGAGSCPPSRVSRRGRWVPGRCIGGRLPWRHGGRISAPPAPCVRKPERVRPADRGERDDGRRGSIRRRESGTPSVPLSASSPFPCSARLRSSGSCSSWRAPAWSIRACA